MLNLLRNSHQRKKNGQALYDGLVSRAREPVFFADFGVADSIDGRFDVLVFHGWMVLAELKGAPSAQGLTDAIFTGFDEAMREQGAGDMGIGHKLKAMANAFYGRLSAYDAAKDEAALAEALAKNLWRGAAVDGRARVLAAYAMRARDSLRRSLPDGLDFGALPEI
ncbi:MAG TPA: ubiquinol-cytochrome C chaperone family protein [Rhizomicrobium sp.]|nr:ubiquinol-cytochrome C chaperone family protein [Rhizomicrobium sp.]